MKERCNNSHNKSYKNYGNKGIKVCKEWEEDFSQFREWAINSGYKKGLTIDRINPAKNYCPENCRWATTKQQNRNYSRNRKINYNGTEYCVIELAEKFNINYGKLLYRINAGYSVEDAIKGEKFYGKKKRII